VPSKCELRIVQSIHSSETKTTPTWFATNLTVATEKTNLSGTSGTIPSSVDSTMGTATGTAEENFILCPEKRMVNRYRTFFQKRETSTTYLINRIIVGTAAAHGFARRIEPQKGGILIWVRVCKDVWWLCHFGSWISSLKGKTPLIRESKPFFFRSLQKSLVYSL